MCYHWVVIVFLFVSFCNQVTAQIDSLAAVDSTISDRKLEDLLEQTGDQEDSPLIEFYDRTTERRTSFLQVRSRYIQRLQKSDGFQNQTYTGSILKSYQRIKFSPGNHFSGGVLMEKDAGEKRLNDFTTGNLMISNIGPVSKSILGDYFIEAGQGLALWRSYDIAKGADVILPVRRNGTGLNPYLSSGESGFFRGVATELKFGRFSSTVFYSNVNRCGSLDTSDNLKSFYDVGYFRTEGEMQKKNAITENLLGAQCVYGLSNFNSIGATFYTTRYSRKLLFRDGQKFSGDRFSIASLDYSFAWQRLSLFGEVAGSNKVIAGNSGIVLTPSDEIGIILSARYYPYRFISIHGLGFGEQTSNEQGFYFGVHLKLIDWMAVASYYDQYGSVDKSSLLFPVVGNDFLTQVELSFLSNLDVTVKYHRKITDDLQPIIDESGFGSKVITQQRKQNIRLSVDYKMSSRVSLRCRVEEVFLNNKSMGSEEKGFLTYQDVLFKPNRKVLINLRVAYFRSGSYYSGVGEYERDLDGVLTQPILYGSGVRWYCLLKYEPIRQIKLSFKYSDYIRDDVKRIGTGLDELPGNHDNRVSAQLDFGF
jgi:hypothetical protein